MAEIMIHVEREGEPPRDIPLKVPGVSPEVGVKPMGERLSWALVGFVVDAIGINPPYESELLSPVPWLAIADQIDNAHEAEVKELKEEIAELKSKEQKESGLFGAMTKKERKAYQDKIDTLIEFALKSKCDLRRIQDAKYGGVCIECMNQKLHTCSYGDYCKDLLNSVKELR